MKYEYSLHPDAEQEYINAYVWYEEQSVGLGAKLADTVRAKLDEITSNPEIYHTTKGRFRETVLSTTFPFVIVYIIEKRLKRVVVMSIFHTSRNPRLKYRKK